VASVLGGCWPNAWWISAPTRDVITVTGDDAFRNLKFKVIDAPIQMLSMRVEFENGEVQDSPVDFRMEKVHESRVIDLNGVVRAIKVVSFTYRTVRPGVRGKAKLLRFGQKRAGPLEPKSNPKCSPSVPARKR